MITEEIVKSSHSLSEVCRQIGWSINGMYIGKVKKFVEENEIDVSHFDQQKKNRKYEVIEKDCPVCTKTFKTQKGHSREKITCSKGCSNTYFRSGEDNPNWKSDEDAGYRQVCFRHHEKKCVICGEDKIVEVHHLYGKIHNEFWNLIPMCSNHHKYYHHSKYKELVEHKILDYRQRFIDAHNIQDGIIV